MKNILKSFSLTVFTALFLILSSCDEPYVEVESPEYECDFSFAVKNDSNSDVTVSVGVVLNIGDDVCWDERDRKELTVEAGKSGTISLFEILMDHAFPCDLTFLVDVEGKLYLGFPKTDNRSYMGLYEKNIQTDNLHRVKLFGNTDAPEISGTLIPVSVTGKEDGKKYACVSETISVTINNGVDISLDKVEF